MELDHELDRNELLVPATRYYIGRMTIAAVTHARALAAQWQEIPQNVRNSLRAELEDAFRYDDELRTNTKHADGCYYLGTDIEREAWEDVRKAWLYTPTRENPRSLEND